MGLFTEFYRSAGAAVLFLACSATVNCVYGNTINTQQELQDAVKTAQSMAPVSLIARSTLLNNSKIFNVSLSPNGQYLSYMQKLGRSKQKLAALWLYDIDNQQHKKLFSFKNVKRTTWSKDGSAIFLSLPNAIAVSRISDNQQGSSPISLVDFKTPLKERWLGIDHSQQNSFIVQLWNEKNEQFEITRIKANGDRETLYITTEKIRGFSTHYQTGKPLYIKQLNQAEGNLGESHIYHISGGKKQLIWQCQWDDPCDIYHYEPLSKTLILHSNLNANLSRLVKVDTLNNKVTEYHVDPNNYGDLYYSQFVQADNTNNNNTNNKDIMPVFVSYYGDTVNNYGLTELTQQHLNYLEHKLNTQSLMINIPEYESRLDKVWLVKDLDNRSAVAKFYLYFPKDQRLLKPLADIEKQTNKDHPLVKDHQISPKFAIHYQARDNFALQGYLTLPTGIDIETAPLVVFPHGGPWSRTTDSYNASVQLLANRGYVVFQPNFRASTGFGKLYNQGTNNDFGKGTTHFDIIDGTRFLLDHQIGDKNKVAIVGHSFGGFSVLTALAFSPDLFKAGFAGAPPADIAKSAKYFYRYVEKLGREHNDHFMKTLVVDWDDPEALAAHKLRSPDNHLNKISKPLVMWAGKNDRRVFIADVQDYALRAEELNKKVSLFVDPKALHSPNTHIGFEAYFYLMEKTLADHLGGNLELLDNNQDKGLIRFLNKNLKIDENRLAFEYQ